MATEGLLVLGILAFYLQDCAMLLYQDEMLVVGDGTRWRIRADAGTRWSGRYLALPEPLRPDLLLFRATWAAAPPGDDALAPGTLAKRLKPLRAGCAVLFALWLVAVPVLLFRLPGSPALLATAAAVYLIAATLGLWLWLRRADLGLPARDAAALIAEAVLCPPFSVLLARKVCFRAGLRGDPLVLASGLQPAERQALKSAIEARMDGLLAFSEPDSAGAIELVRERARLEQRLP